MARHIWSVFCEKSIIAQDGRVSMLNCIEAAQIKLSAEDAEKFEKSQVPLTIPQENTLVSLWVRENRETPEVATCRMFFRDPNGKILRKKGDIEINLRESVRGRVTMYSRDWVLSEAGEHPTSGEYCIEIQQQRKSTGGRIRWRTEASIPVVISMEFTSPS